MINYRCLRKTKFTPDAISLVLWADDWESRRTFGFVAVLILQTCWMLFGECRNGLWINFPPSSHWLEDQGANSALKKLHLDTDSPRAPGEVIHKAHISQRLATLSPRCNNICWKERINTWIQFFPLRGQSKQIKMLFQRSMILPRSSYLLQREPVFNTTAANVGNYCLNYLNCSLKN